MDPTQIKKIQAMNRYKRRQFLDNLYFYSLTALFCCVTLCLPYLSSLLRVFFSVQISSLIPVLLSSKLLFFIGNLIIFFLVVNSRIFSSTTSDVYYEEYIQSSQNSMPQIQTIEVKKVEKYVVEMRREEEVMKKSLNMKGKVWVEKGREAWETREKENLDIERNEKSLICSSDELNKRADDFIARVNRQRKLELSLLQNGSY